MTNEPTKKIRDRVTKEYRAEQTQVLSLLAQYGADYPESERVQLAILDLAKGQLSQVSTLVELARLDYRDVLLQAEYLNDPFNLLQSLLQDLQGTGVFTAEEAAQTMRSTGGTNYRNAFSTLSTIITERGKKLSPMQYQMIDKLGRALKLPVKNWKSLASQVE